MKFNSIMFLTIVLLAILSLGAVSAHDDVADDISVADSNDEIQLNSINDSKLSDNASASTQKTIYVGEEGDDSGAGSQNSPYASINKALSDVNASDDAVIYLGEGTFNGDNNTNLEINLAHKNYNGSLTIIGKGDGKTIIDANDEAPIIKSVSADSIVTLINITFTHGKNDMGSAIRSSGELTIDNCVFEENYVTNLGAIYSENGNLSIQNSKFYRNSGNQYVDLYFSHNGLVTLINNIFESGTATSSWADTPAVYVGTGKSVIKGNTFKNLTSSSSAAGLAVRYNNEDNIANITDNTFVNCTYTGSNGAIIFFQNSYLKGNKFIDCTSTTSFLYSVTDFNAKVAFDDVKVEGTSFVLKANVTDDMDNKVQGAKIIFAIDGANIGSATSGAKGVASINVNKLLENGEHTISGTQAYSDVNVFNVTVINGIATVDFDHSPADVWVSTEGNDTTGDGSEANPFLTLKKALDYGTDASVDLTVHIKNGLYNGSGNRDLSYSNVGKITIIGESYGNVIIDAEHTRSGEGWLASASDIFTFGQNLEIKLVNLTLINCDGNPVDAYSLTMNDNIVINSGTIRAQSSNDVVLIDNIKIINGTNQAINAYNLVLTNSLFENCNGKTSTGLLWLSTNNGHVLQLENNTFKGNMIEGYSGGSAYYAQGDMVSINNTFDSNTVTGSASNIAYASGNNITSINDKFINNNVTSYVAQYRSSGNYLTEIIVENITFINNRASANGAGLVTTGAKIKGGKFINNTAAGNGGAIYLLNHGKTYQVCEMSIEDITFADNRAACGNDIFIAPSAGNNVFANLTDLTITANSKNVTELCDIMTVTVSHPSGAIIGGGQVTFYFNGSMIGKSDLINQNATLQYVGFKNNTEYNFTSVYEYATENDVNINGVVSTNIADALDSIELYVSDILGDDEKGNGSENNPFKSISKALSEGNSKSTNITVHVLEGNYTGELNTNLRIPTTVDVLIVGEDADKVIVSDSTADYFITALSGNAKLTLVNVTLNRAARDTQSAIYVEEGADMEIDSVKFIGGQGNYGGAINTTGILFINNSYFFDNGYADIDRRANAYCGGAIYNDGVLIIVNSTFEANHAGRLSTIANQGTLYMNNSQVIDSLDAYAMNMDLVAIGAFGGQIGNITIENSIFTVTNKTIAELSNRIYTPQNSLTCLAIGSSQHVTIINSTFEDKGGRYTPNAFGGINSWNLAGGGTTMLPGDMEVYNSTFRNLQSVSLFYSRTDNNARSNRLFDGCLFENVEYLIAVLNQGENLSVNITNSVILSDNVTKIGVASGKAINMTFSNNWWGSNNATYKNATISTSNFISNYVLKIREISSEVVNPENYLVLTLNQTGDNVELAFKSFDGENLTDYEGSLFAREFTINATGAVLGSNNGTIVNKVTISVSVDGLSYTIEATVDNQTVNLTVVRKETQIRIDSINADLSINASLTDIDGNPVSNVTVSYEIGDVKENVTTDENGIINIPCVANGEVLIKFEGNGANLASNNTFTFDVIKQDADPEMEVPGDVVAGDDAMVIVTIANATGNVSIFVDGIEQVVPLNENGVAILTMENAAAGNHSIVAVYAGDNNVAPATIAKTLTVAKATPDVSADAQDIAEGETVTIEVEVDDDATGIVLVNIDGKKYYGEIDSGKASIAVDGLKAGDYTVDVIYDGDEKYTNRSDSITINVADKPVDPEPVAPEVNVTVPDTKAGENTSVDVELPEDATGNVTVKVDGEEVATVPVENGAASIPLENLAPGAYLIETSYTGDEKYAPVSDAKAILVENETQPEDNNITVIVDGKKYPAEVINGTATVKTNATEPDNNVTVVVDGKEYPGELVNGTVTVDTNATKPVVKKDTIIEVDSAFTRVANDYYAGERGAFFYAVLKDSDGNVLANKNVSIAVNGPIYNVTTDDQGRAGLQVNFMIANVYTYALSFKGDDEYNAASIASSKLTITKKSISISASSKSFKAKAKKTIKVTLKAAKNPYDGKVYLKAGKKVTLKVNGKKYTAKANKKGVAKFTIKLTKKGKYTAKIKFAGDKTYKSANKSIKITIK